MKGGTGNGGKYQLTGQICDGGKGGRIRVTLQEVRKNRPRKAKVLLGRIRGSQASPGRNKADAGRKKGRTERCRRRLRED